MKVTQDKPAFQPITIVLETAEEVAIFKQMCYYTTKYEQNGRIFAFANQLRGELDAKTL